MNLLDRLAEGVVTERAVADDANAFFERQGVVVGMPERDMEREMDEEIEQCVALMRGVDAIAKNFHDLGGHELVAELAKLRPLVERAAAAVGESPPDLDHHDGAWTLADVVDLALRWEAEIGGIEHEIGWLYVADLLLRLGSGERPD